MPGLRLLLAIALALHLAACIQPPRYPYEHEPDPRKQGEFVLGPGDGVQITVWKTPELNTGATIRPDGYITMPLVGDLWITGKTPSEVRKLVSEKIAQYIKGDAAFVTVAVTGISSYRYTLQGNFERNGVYAQRYYITCSEAIAIAGGISKFGNPRRLILQRRGSDGKIKRIPLDYTRLVTGEHLDEDLVLLAGDVLIAE